MKAILVNNDTVTIGQRAYPMVTLYADSAIGRDVMPLFVPDIDVKWRSSVCVAARILRLGKNVSEKFALRYVDAIGLVNVLEPDSDDTASEAFASSLGYTILDSAVTTGRWIERTISADMEIDVKINGEERHYTGAQLAIAPLVSRVSSIATIKTGDIIILHHTAIEVPFEIGAHIEGDIDSERCLHVRIK